MEPVTISLSGLGGSQNRIFNEIVKEFKVNITILSASNMGHVISMSGLRGSVQRAKEALLDRVQI